MIRRIFCGLMFALANVAVADSYPSKPIRFVLPVSAGASSNDILGRGLAQRLSERLGQQIVVDNRPGVSGSIGSKIVAMSEPDGYTILLAYTSAQAISPNIYKNIGYDPIRDLAPVAQFCVVPYVVVAHPSVPAKNLKELIALAKSRPGTLNVASAGTGSTPHLASELFKLATGTNIVHVPYKSGALAAIDLLGGHVQLYFSGITSMASAIKSGRLRAIALMAPNRSSLMPEIPTTEESGLPGVAVSSWLGIAAPARTPEPRIRHLHSEIKNVVDSSDMKRFLQSQGAEPALMDPAQFGAHMKAELDKWAKVVRAINLKRK